MGTWHHTAGKRVTRERGNVKITPKVLEQNLKN